MKARTGSKLPRLVSGDSPAACLKAARKLMAQARTAAANGERELAGTLAAQACETGAYLLPGAPAGMYPNGWSGSAWRSYSLEADPSSPDRIYCDHERAKLSPVELASRRVADGRTVRDSEEFNRLSHADRKAIRERANEEEELEEAHAIGLVAEEIAQERQRLEEIRQNRLEAAKRRGPRADRFAGLVERHEDEPEAAEAFA